MLSRQIDIRIVSDRAILIMCLVTLAAGPITACSGEMMEATPVCMETNGMGPQIVPMYKCEGDQGGTLINK